VEKFLNLEGLDYVCGKLRSDLSGKQAVLTGQPGQTVGFDAAGAAIAQNGWSNPNLLDNWYFRNPVNQRGLAEYGEGYTIDRWCLYVSGTTTISIENGVVIHEGAGGYFQQRLERSKMEKLLGQAATLSVLINNQLYSATDLLGYPGNRCIIRGLPIGESSLFWDDVKCEVNFSLAGGAGVLQAVKLELGTIQTLAHQDASGNWVLSDPPPDPALELAKCQRYQFVIRAGMLNDPYPTVGMGIARSAAEMNLMIPLPTTMRARPSISVEGNGIYVRNSMDTGKNLHNIEVDTFNGTTLLCKSVLEDGNFTVSGAYQAFLAGPGNSSKVVIDANL